MPYSRVRGQSVAGPRPRCGGATAQVRRSRTAGVTSPHRLFASRCGEPIRPVGLARLSFLIGAFCSGPFVRGSLVDAFSLTLFFRSAAGPGPSGARPQSDQTAPAAATVAEPIARDGGPCG